MIHLRIASTLAIMLVYLSLFAQDNPLSTVYPPSPNSTKFAEVAKHSLEGNTGAANISIPLYVIKDGSIEIPLTLQYNSNGIKPNEPISWVGRGWVLNVGGCVTRVVKTLPDENDRGFFNLPDLSITRRDQNYYDNMNPVVDDLNPDVFYFNFMGHTGEFYKTNLKQHNNWEDLDMASIPHKNFKYNFSELGDKQNGKIRRIQINDDDGIRYFFGGENNYEYTKGDDDKEISTSWYLSRIVSATGRQVHFKYNEFYLKNFYVPEVYCEVELSDGTEFGGGTHGSITNYSMQKNLVLSEIITPNYKIVFTSSDCKGLSVNGEQNISKKLDCIEIFNIKDLERPIKKFDFKYDNYDLPPLILSEVQELGGNFYKSPHEFLYYVDNTPGEYSNAIDPWGYFNGSYNGNNVTFVPNQTDNQDGTYDYGFRNCATDDQEQGMLKTVIYPTGGIMELVYEPNKFKFFGKYTYEEKLRYHELEEEKLTAGVRVKKVIYKDGDTFENALEETYTYKDGVLKVLPNFKLEEEGFTGQGEDFFMYERSRDSYVPYSGSHINYGNIIIERKNKGIEERTYTTSVDKPDYTISNLTVFTPIFSSKEMYRNRISSVNYYSNSDYNLLNPIKTVEYSYVDNTIENIFAEGNIKIAQVDKVYRYENGQEYSWSPPTYYNPYEIDIGFDYLESITTTEKFDGSELVTVEQFNYDQNEYEEINNIHLLKQKTNIVGDDITSIHFTYPTCYTYSDYYLSMANANYILFPVEKLTEKNNYLVAGEINNYLFNNNTINLVSTYDLKSNAGLYSSTNSIISVSDIGGGTFTDVASVRKDGRILAYGTPATLLINDNYRYSSFFHGYNDYGNLLKYTGIDEIQYLCIQDNSPETMQAIVSGKDLEFKMSPYSWEVNSEEMIFNGFTNEDIILLNDDHDVLYKKQIGKITFNNDNEYAVLSKGESNVSDPYYWLFIEDENSNLMLNINIASWNVVQELRKPIGEYDVYIVSSENISDWDIIINCETHNLVPGVVKYNAFFNGFEYGNDEGVVNEYSNTGNFSFKGNYEIDRSMILDGEDYLLTYWSSVNGLDWQFNTTSFDISENSQKVTIGGDAIYIDDIRVTPKNGEMISYTYNSFGSITSSTDKNNLVTFYEYDSFNRLVRIRDNDHNIVKHFTYNESGDCPIPGMELVVTDHSDKTVSYELVDDLMPSGSTTTCEWTFESNTTTSTNGTYQYSTPGTHIIKLETENTMCGTFEQEKTVHILEEPDVSFYYVGDKTIHYNSNNNNDATVICHFDFGDGTSEYASSGIHQYSTEGTYLITVNVSIEGKELTYSVTKEIEVFNINPFNFLVEGPYDRYQDCDGNLDNNQTTFVNIEFDSFLIEEDDATIVIYEKYCDNQTLINGTCDSESLSMIDYTKGIGTPISLFEMIPGNISAPFEQEFYCKIYYKNIIYKTETLYFSCKIQCNE